jgi:hypothetical protein
MHSQSQSVIPRAGLADYVLPSSTEFCIFLPSWNCVSNSLQGHQLVKSVGWFNLWKQVQKAEEPVDITSLGALIDAGGH